MPKVKKLSMKPRQKTTDTNEPVNESDEEILALRKSFANIKRKQRKPCLTRLETNDNNLASPTELDMYWIERSLICDRS